MEACEWNQAWTYKSQLRSSYWNKHVNYTQLNNAGIMLFTTEITVEIIVAGFVRPPLFFSGGFWTYYDWVVLQVYLHPTDWSTK
jgi:hypothetical protein